MTNQEINVSISTTCRKRLSRTSHQPRIQGVQNPKQTDQPFDGGGRTRKKNGDGEDRIRDLTQVRGLYSDAKRALYQLSYVPDRGRHLQYNLDFI